MDSEKLSNWYTMSNIDSLGPATPGMPERAQNEQLQAQLKEYSNTIHTFMQQIQAFTLQNATDPALLSTFSTTVQALHQKSLQMPKGKYHDAARIIETILTQTVAISGVSQPISLLEAANSFTSQEAATSDFSKIVQTFMQYPNTAQTLVNELDTLSKELK